MEYILIGITAFFASLLTFFSGFGLSTILTPVFILFFPVEVAIGSTAIVHFLNNLFKFGLIGKSVDWSVVLRFGIPAIFGAFVGASLLTYLDTGNVLVTYTLLGIECSIETVKLVISVIMMFFAIIEIAPVLDKLKFDRKKLPYGGVISGIFGGLSGHQGALRSLFLLHCGLSRQAFIASGVAIATIIDITRISVYLKDLSLDEAVSEWPILVVAIIAAFIGAILGKNLLKKVTIQFVQITVSVLIFILALLLGLGII